MKILSTFPPNYQQIKNAVNPPPDAVFPFGDKLYNPSGAEIPADIQYHEACHQKRQKEIGINIWWTKWINDKDFRLKEELIAFKGQLIFIKATYPAAAVKEALDEMAENLSKNYNLNISTHKAHSLIRHYGENKA